MSVPITLSDLESEDARGYILRLIYLLTLVPFDLERPNSTVQHSGEERISRGHPRLRRKGAEPSAPQRRTAKFDVVIHMGRGLFLWPAMPHLMERGSPVMPNFGGSQYIYA